MGSSGRCKKAPRRNLKRGNRQCGSHLMVTHFEDLSDGANKVRIEDQEEEGSFYEQIDKIFVEKSLSLVCFYGRIDKYLKIAENPKRTSSQSSVDAIEKQ